MHSALQLQSIVDQAISGRAFPSHPKELYDPIQYLMGMGAKRLRPVLLLMACEMFGGKPENAIHPAVAIELFHNFTLMHDDIMDKAPLRRGQATVHVKWNPDIAILSGDVMLVEAYKLMMQVDNAILRQVLDLFNRTAVEVCEGQQIDMNFESLPDVAVGNYIHMISLKTAALLAASLQIGAWIGGAGEKDSTHLYEFGKHIGIAFQLQDDLLDVYGDPEKFGKQVGGDILSNKKTFLLIRALELAKGNDQDELQYWMSSKAFDPAEKIAAVRNFYDRLELKEIITAEINKFAGIAFGHLQSIDLPSENKKILQDFTAGLMQREQ